MKKNKLYTVNKWNQPAFVDRTYQNVYDGFGTSFLNSANSAVGEGGIKGALSFGGIGGLGSSLGSTAGSMLKGGLGGIGSAVGGAVGNLIGGGYESGVGNALGSLGKVASVIPGPWGAAISGGLQILGGGINALWGTKVDEAKLKANQEGTNTLLNFASNAGSFDDIKGVTASSNVQDAYAGGVFKKDWAERKNAEVRKWRNDALAFADRSIGNNIFNLANDQTNDALANYSAYGGPIDIEDDNMSAIDYDFMDRYMTAKEKQNESKNKVSNTPSMPAFMQNGFALGGVLQSHGSDWGTGLMTIGAGGSHEENKYDGVQLGVDDENVPNLVEEGETVYNQYVFSRRILADEATKQVFKLPRKKDITFADISKKLEKEIAERPNDPISEAGFEAQMQKLQEQQERQKQEMEAKRAKAAFEALSPEEQTALMQQRAQQEAMAQQAAQEQAMAEQQTAVQQATPEELAMAQQAQMQADGTQAMVGQEAPMMAYGGKVNRYADGGLKKKIYSLLGRATDKDFRSWLDEMGDEDLDQEAIMDALSKDDYKALIKNPAFIRALQKEDRGLAHSVSLGNNFGMFIPDASGATFTDPDKGNWDRQMFEGWNGSKDAAWEELVDKYGIDRLKGIKNREDLERIFKETNAYKNTTKWLQSNPENMRKYLKSVLDTSSSRSAKEHALQFVNEDGTWKDANKIPTYAQIFGENGKGVRETYPGTYWHSVVEANRGKEQKNYLINDDGSVDLIEGTTDGLTAAGTHSWQSPENDMTVNYFTRPVAATPEEAKTPEQKAAEEESGIVPRRRWEDLRYAGLFGPAVGLGMQALGIGRPDTSGIDAAINAANGSITEANYQPIGNYLTYRPMDIWYQQNALNAQSRATDRALLNNSSPSRAAGVLANGYNSQLASGNLYRQALEYNDALEKQVADFNRGTDMFNAEAYNRNSQFNADARNRARQYGAQIALQGAAQKADMDAGWYNGLYGNVAGVFKGLGDIGRENVATNWRNALTTAGAFGAMDEDELVRADISKYKNGKKSAKGGKIKKGKRGLTI